jgi:hypothetical protein
MSDSQIEDYLEFLKEAETDNRAEEYLLSVKNEEEGDEQRIRQYEMEQEEEEAYDNDYYYDYYEHNDYIHCSTPIASFSSEESLDEENSSDSYSERNY